MNDTTQIKCPNCGTLIDVQDILAHQLEDEIRQKYQSQLADEKRSMKQSKKNLTGQNRNLRRKGSNKMNCFRNVWKNN
ncbi:hypothetical protein [Pareuzebyella sediminis]|uniref:hypothetical protein n=1 Tax=Pareuzebyella sediminis TaxID=2607998 RepID=UPI0018E1887C|nr:hypothetical protein [Pareuzebyella sediminis]